MSTAPSDAVRVRRQFEEAWPRALEVWSKFTRLRPPILCPTSAAAQAEGLTASFAMIRLVDQAIVIDLEEVARQGLGDYATEVLAHEIGHHVLAPATLTEHTRMVARMRRALPTIEQQAPLVANLYTDLLINDRLQRSAELRVDHIYRVLTQESSSGVVWRLYLRIYEVLWSLERGSLCGGKLDDRLEGDAWLGARLIRSYQRDWLDGSGRFAALFFPHFLEDSESAKLLQVVFDTRAAAAGGQPHGLTDVDPEEATGAIHPADDPELNEAAQESSPTEPAEGARNGAARGQARQPFEYGEVLRAAGLHLDDHELAVRYYKERALPYLVPFPSRPAPQSTDPLPEGLEPWEVGDPLDAVDWLQSVLFSPHIVPGVTTVQRLWGVSEGTTPHPVPLDLDIYVDSSGSMANPQRELSYPALAGAIICLSALRAGARVQATLWSGTRQFISTPGFVRHEAEILRVLTGFFGGGTAFPIHVLRDTFQTRAPNARPVHVLIVSDDGVTTLFAKDEKGNDGKEVARMALQRAGGGGTMVLNLNFELDQDLKAQEYWRSTQSELLQMRDELGFGVFRVSSWEGLMHFARVFSRQRYGGPAS